MTIDRSLLSILISALFGLRGCSSKSWLRKELEKVAALAERARQAPLPTVR